MLEVAAVPLWEKASFIDMVQRCIDEYKTVCIEKGELDEEECDDALLRDFSRHLKGKLADDDHAWPTVEVSMEEYCKL